MWTPPEGLVRLQAHLLRAEKAIALLDHCLPRNFPQEVAQLTHCLARDQPYHPRFTYTPRHSGLREACSVLRRLLEAKPPSFSKEPDETVSSLLMERAEELLLEAELASSPGAPTFRQTAKRYLACLGGESKAADSLARRWLRETPSVPEEERTDSETLPISLGLAHLAGRIDLAVPIVERDIASLCAVSEEAILVKCGARAVPSEVERVFVHEVLGHYLPRKNARRLPPPFAVGTRGSFAEEEGRAVWLEERLGLLSARRMRALAVRHQLAVAVLLEEDAVELARSLVRSGLGPAQVARALCRSLRGGGLAREAVYLPAFICVKKALEDEPEREGWMRAGRISLDAATRLKAAGLSPQSWSSITTGAWSEGFVHLRGSLSMLADCRRSTKGFVMKM